MTAGKDRTGVLAAMLLSLAGADAETIDHDYALTRVGIEPVRELLVAKLVQGRGIDMNSPLMKAYADISLDAMSHLLEAMDKAYGGPGAEGYVKTKIGFSEEDIERLRTNLRGLSE